MFHRRQLAKISPQRVLSFFVKDSCPPTAWLSITNTTDTRIAFKIKTTSPDAYQVDSHRGLIDAKTCIDVPIVLKRGINLRRPKTFDGTRRPERGGQNTIQSDKFAVLVMRVGDERIHSKRALDQKWNCATRDRNPCDFMEQRMRCALFPYSMQDPACRSDSMVPGGASCVPSCDGEGDDSRVKQPKCIRRTCPPTCSEDGAVDDGCSPVPASIVEKQKTLEEKLNSLSKINTLTIASIIIGLLAYLYFLYSESHPKVPLTVEDCSGMLDKYYGFGA